MVIHPAAGPTDARWSVELQSPSIRYGFSVVSVAVALGVGLACQYYGFRAAELQLFNLAIVVATWYAGAGPSVLAVVLSAACFAYFFAEPIYSFEISPEEIPSLLLFTAWAALIARFVAIRRSIEEELRQARDRFQIEAEERAQQANLLNLTFDAILVRDMTAVITYWNRGAEELYGWTPQQAIGKRSHELFRTTFPAPLVDIEAELERTGRWEG
ncbi:MAG TPA: DUF4118 domain-containing protein, partial [Bradyrhizobium sp.]|nr:DUF4118 domain-containing protein [Bradyrhizobium sp.]